MPTAAQENRIGVPRCYQQLARGHFANQTLNHRATSPSQPPPTGYFHAERNQARVRLPGLFLGTGNPPSALF